MPISPPDPTGPAPTTAAGGPRSTRPAWSPLLLAGIRQLGLALVTLLAVSAVTFLATNIKSPQDVARSTLGRQAAPEQIAAFVQRHDLDASLPQRYAAWLGNFGQGEWGTSVITDRPVQPELLPRLERTVLLVGWAFALVVPLSIGLGAVLARRWGSRVDVAATSGLTVLRAVPEFVVGVGMIVVCSMLLGILPPESGTGLAFGSSWQRAQAYVLPVLTLVLVAAPFLVRMTRASAWDGLVAPHTRAAALLGLPPRTVIWSYGMRSAALPIVTAAGLTLVHLLGGTIVVENVFGFPGLGQALVTAVGTGDTVAVQAIAVVTAALFIGVSLLTDLLALWLNPRLQSAP